jgi:hypothetical protein
MTRVEAFSAFEMWNLEVIVYLHLLIGKASFFSIELPCWWIISAVKL